MIGLAGCRLGDGRLHIGHINGCFSQAEVRAAEHVFFIIQDNISEQLSCGDYWARLGSMVSVINAYSNVEGLNNVRIVRQSRICLRYSYLFYYIHEMISFNLLAGTLPFAVAQGVADGKTVADTQFPIHQAAQILGLGIDNVFLNDDNMRYVYFARDIRRRLVYRSAFDLPRPILILPTQPRLFGPDWRKMAKSNGNTLHLDMKPEEIEHYIKQLSRMKYMFKNIPDKVIEFNYLGEEMELPARHPLVCLYLAITKERERGPFRVADLSDMRKRTTTEIVDLFQRINVERSRLENDTTAMFTDVDRAEALAEERIDKMLNQIKVKS